MEYSMQEQEINKIIEENAEDLLESIEELIDELYNKEETYSIELNHLTKEEGE